ncbi:transposase [Candidatus Sulfotelmatobacter kueseliae]|uniref:Transposase n=1 Tax=Candidatus Sulfotelmatobacter kueseliae TaxID=2042962 RepID=A0A2U3JYZ8_9BACT|nr:transposase [Candidatus Sulfotelmatobacter kueseliae]
MVENSCTYPQTLVEAIRYFQDPAVCVEFMAQMRWPLGVECPHCQSKRHSFLRTRRIWKCLECRKQFSAKVGTVFEDSAIPLDKWLTAVWLVVNCKNGISSWELHRTLKVTQKAAWFMLHRIRTALQDVPFGKMGGPGVEVEVDETYVGAKAENIHKSRKERIKRLREQTVEPNSIMARYYAKTPIQGFLDREERKVRATVIPNVKRETLQERILSQVEKGSHVYTDQAMAYTHLQSHFVHEVVNHLETYVKGRVHTNGLENFWSLLKRSLKGSYVAVEPFHLFRYVDEQVFRYNNRATKENPLNDADRFLLAMHQVAGKRLTYAEVTGKAGTTPF